jgi:hypothetical protein
MRVDEEFAVGTEENKPARDRLADIARQEEKRQRLIEFLEREEPAWKDADHPEIEAAGGSAAWVRKMRQEAEKNSRRRRRDTSG